MEAFASYMRDIGKEWVDFVCYACHSNSVSVPEIFDILPPESRRILLYPEITMVDNCGTIGAMPIVEQFAYSIKRRFDIGRLCIENGGWINVGMHWLNADLPVAFNPATMYGAVCGTFTYIDELFVPCTRQCLNLNSGCYEHNAQKNANESESLYIF